jgi:CHAT domain-containing protein/Tfp pilus assembly protein PilF
MTLKANADRLFYQGLEQCQSSDLNAALQSWQQALIIYREICDCYGEGSSLKNLGGVYFSLEQYQQAIEYYQQSAAINWEIDNRTEVVIVLNILGIAYCNLGYYQQAIDSFEHSLAIAQEIGDSEDEATSLGGLGNVYYCQGEYWKAIKYYKQSLDIAQKIGDQFQESASLGGLGNAYSCLGHYQTALEYAQQMLAMVQKSGNFQGEATALCNLGNYYDCLGQYQKAIEHYHKSLNLARQISDYQVEIQSLDGLGTVSSHLQKDQKAIEYYQKSLGIAQKIGDRRGEAIIKCNLGHVSYNRGQYQQAIEYYWKSLDIAQNIDHYPQQAVSLSGLGSAYCSLGKSQKAIDYYQQSIGISRKIQEPRVEGNALNNLGYALLKAGRIAEAEKTLFAAMKVKESLRIGLQDTYKVSIFEKHGNTYCLLQEVLILQNKSKEALEIAERGRARALLDLLTQRLSSQVADEVTITPPTLQEIQKIAQVQNSTLLEYSIIYDEPGEESELYIWIIEPTGEVTFCQVDLKPLQQQNTSLSGLVIQGRASLGVEEKLRDAILETKLEVALPIRHISQPLRKLHQYLIEPIANLLPTDPNAHVIFIPQGSLFLVPFPALQDATGKFLIEQHTILTAPSIQVLELTRKQRQRVETIHELPLQSQNALVVGNPKMPTIPLREPLEPLPPLPGAEAEANAIASLLNTQAIIGDAATKIDIVQQMPKARLIHLATHGLLDDIKQLGVPGAIALAPSDNDNGFLTAGEILEMKLNAELIVLSACSSGQGKITGDGVIGLSRSLFAAGVPSVIVSLWSVGDDSTEFLMTEFYQNLQNGMNKAQALRQAILKTREDFSDDPYSWAAFTLIGEAE